MIQQQSIKYRVRVTIEKEIEIEFPPEFFSPMTQDQFLTEFNRGMWTVEGMSGVAEYAARMAAQYGGGIEHDALGLLGEHYSTYPRVPDVKFRELNDECETEVIA